MLESALPAREQGQPRAGDFMSYLQTRWPAITANSYKDTPGAKKRGVEKEALGQGVATRLYSTRNFHGQHHCVGHRGASYFTVSPGS